MASAEEKGDAMLSTRFASTKTVATATSSTSTAATPPLPQQSSEAALAAACKTLLECLGEDVTRDGLRKTPLRMARALLFATQGYRTELDDIVNGAVFEEDHHELVVVRDIDLHSMCEHHMLPFMGKVHIGYIPNGHVLGLSKFARIADMFARRLQVQERLTREIADAVMEVLQPKGVVVVIEASHMCMVMRGVEKAGSSTVSTCFRGVFKANREKRNDFFTALRLGSGGR